MLSIMSPRSLRSGTLILSLSLSLISQCLSRTNKCNTTDNRATEDKYVWYSTTDFVPLDGISCGEMYLGHINTVEFDFVWNGRVTEDEVEMFFRVGFDSVYGNGCSGQQSQYPSFWIADDNDYFMIGVSDHSSCSHKYYLDDYDDVTRFVSHHFLIYWDDDILSVNITGGGKDDYYRTWNKTYMKYDHVDMIVPVWFHSTKFGSTEYNRANGTFSNIVMTAKQFANTSMPTMEPTAPTLVPSADPTLEPTFEITGDEQVCGTRCPPFSKICISEISEFETLQKTQ